MLVIYPSSTLLIRFYLSSSGNSLCVFYIQRVESVPYSEQNMIFDPRVLALNLTKGDGYLWSLSWLHGGRDWSKPSPNGLLGRRRCISQAQYRITGRSGGKWQESPQIFAIPCHWTHREERAGWWRTQTSRNQAWQPQELPRSCFWSGVWSLCALSAWGVAATSPLQD